VDFTGPLVQPGFTTKRFYQALPGGPAYIARLAEHCRKRGVAIHTSTRAKSLEQSSGRVSAVKAEHGGKPETFFATRGVVLASGDLSAAKDLREDLWGKDLEALQPLNPASTGDGHRMAMALGAHMVVRPDLVPHGTPRFAIPKHCGIAGTLPASRPMTRAMKWAMKILPQRLLRPFVMRAAMTALAPERALYDAGAIIVNHSGKRFVDERGAIGDAIAKQENGEAFVVFDGAVAKRFSAWPNFVSTAPGIAYAYVDDYRRARKDIFHEANSIAGLAKQLGCDASALRASLVERNGGQGTPPYIALGPLKTWLLLTQVGLAVDTKLRVLDAGGKPIPGLYAAGGVGQGGLSCTSYHHGHSLAWAFTSGRLAARSAAEDFSPMPNAGTQTQGAH
jgi:fumarate reductase flavoprotein subunit